LAGAKFADNAAVGQGRPVFGGMGHGHFLLVKKITPILKKKS
jgi:hypothetical protein